MPYMCGRRARADMELCACAAWTLHSVRTPWRCRTFLLPGEFCEIPASTLYVATLRRLRKVPAQPLPAVRVHQAAFTTTAVHKWTIGDVASFFADLELAEYIAAVQLNAVDGRMLQDLVESQARATETTHACAQTDARPSFTHSLTQERTRTHEFLHSLKLAHSLTRSLPHSLTHSHALARTHTCDANSHDVAGGAGRARHLFQAARAQDQACSRKGRRPGPSLSPPLSIPE